MQKITPFLWYAKRPSASDAMLKMVKFDIATLEAAFKDTGRK
jgi:hypothetical protein